MSSESRREIFFTFFAGALLWPGNLASAFADHRLVADVPYQFLHIEGEVLCEEFRVAF